MSELQTMMLWDAGAVLVTLVFLIFRGLSSHKK
jgi:hypothetical protein